MASVPSENPKPLIKHRCDEFGWEVPGKNNEEPRQGWNEGPCVLKHNGRYYLQYAAPGTQYRIYGDGNYVGDNPLAPLKLWKITPSPSNPVVSSVVPDTDILSRINTVIIGT